MRVYEILTESSRGLLYRSPGDLFMDRQGNQIKFVSAYYFPEQPGKYETVEDLSAAVDSIASSLPGGAKLQFTNNLLQGFRAFAVLEFDDMRSVGKKIFYGRYFREVKSNMSGLWLNDSLPGYQLQTAASLKSSYKLKPTDIWPGGAKFNSPGELINSMSKSEAGKDWAQETQVLLNGTLPTYVNQKSKETAIRDDLGEVIGPVAFVSGMINTSGSEAARQIINNNAPWNTATQIRFPIAKNNNLIDSEIVLNNGIVLGISSKGKTGANASVKNIYDGIQTISKSSEKKLLTKHKDIIEILEIINKSGMAEGAIILGLRFNIIDQQVAETIRSLIKNVAKDLGSITDKGLAGKLNSFTSRYTPKESTLADSRYSVGYHIMAQVAKDVCDVVNGDPKFGKACLEFLNSSPIIQLYMHTKVQGNDVKVIKFDALYPPNFNGTVRLDAGKTFSAVGMSGKFSFAYKAV